MSTAPVIAANCDRLPPANLRPRGAPPMLMERVHQMVVFVRQAMQAGEGATPEMMGRAGFRTDEVTQAVAEGYIADHVTMGPQLVYVLTPESELLAYRLGWNGK